MAFFGHAATQLDRRIRQSIGDKIADNIMEAAKRAAKKATIDTAVILYQTDCKIRCGESTGNTVVAIIRGGHLVTIMLREKQRNTIEGLRVEQVWDWS